MLVAGAAVATVLLLTVVLLGPWPAYRSSHFPRRRYFRDAVAEIGRQASLSGSADGRLRAGWAEARIAVPPGTPLAGYADRKGRPSTGEHDALHVKALAFSSAGSDPAGSAVIAGSDLLIVPANVARAVRERLAASGVARPESVLFGASHTHSGPGASARGLLSSLFAGRYDPRVEEAVVDAFVRAITSAVKDLKEARLAWSSIEAPAFIRNRTRSAASDAALTDAALDCLVVERDDRRRAILVRYSAHATVLGADSMELSADYPGYLQRAIERRTGAFAVYIGGALGSMGPVPPADSPANGESPDFARARALGEALADLVVRHTAALADGDFREVAAVRAVGLPLRAPPLQLRVSQGLRLSPIALAAGGVSRDAWLGAIRIGDALVFGVPADLSGEVSAAWKRSARERGVLAVPTSFNGAYLGYVSPDAWYGELRDAKGIRYETGLMSWCGPDQEAYFSALFLAALDGLWPEPEAKVAR